MNRAESYIVASSLREAKQEARRTYSRQIADTREEADALAARLNAEHGYVGHYRVFVDVIEEVAA